MYSTKLTVSHSICSELTPPPPQKKRTQLSVVFLSVFFFSIFFSVCYIQKALLLIKQSKVHSAHPPVPTMYNPNVSIQLPSPANSTLDFNILKKTKQKKRNGEFEKVYSCVFFPFFFSCQSVWSGNNLQKKQKSNTTFSSIWIYKKMQCRKNTLFG